MDLVPRLLEVAFLYSSSAYILLHTWHTSQLLCILYLAFLLALATGLLKLARTPTMVFGSPLGVLNAFLYATILLGKLASAQSPDRDTVSSAPSAFTSSASTLSTAGPSATVAVNGTLTETFRPIFTVPADADEGAMLIPNINDPDAVDAQTVCSGYKAEKMARTPYGLTATLALAGDACNVYGNDVEELNLTVQYQAADRLAVNIHPSSLDEKNTSWFILPEYLVPSPGFDEGYGGASGNISIDNDLAFYWNNEPTFSFSVARLETGDVLFSTEGTKIVYEDQFIEFVSSLPENYNLYGLGETIHGLRLGNNFTKTIYAADVGDPIDLNIYGSHPFYVDTRYYQKDNATGNLTLVISNETDASNDYVSFSHGVYNRNAHGQEILLRPSNITWRTLGGSIDLHFYSGPKVDNVLTSFHKKGAGLPVMQQYFSFGLHQSRWGYENWTRLAEVVDNYARFEIPLETIWTDIDYMNQYRDFHNDPIRFGYPEGKEFLSKLHANNQHYMPIVDSAIYVPNPENSSDAYAPFTRGNESEAFILNPDGSLYIGSVWPGYTVFPDWLSGSGGNEWWKGELSRWHEDVDWDSIWIDMSEVSSFCVGSCGSENITMNPVHPPFGLPGEIGYQIYDYPEGFNVTNATEAASASSASSLQAASTATPSTTGSSTTPNYLRTTPTPGIRNVNHPPYVINNVQGDLAVHAVSPNATHHDSTEEYDVHNLWGHGILNATYHALLNVFPSKRPFIIGRSTFVGSGMFAGHWGGDNTSKWYYMYFSIPQALTFSMFGIPMFGVDTCGFNGNSDEELCNRWMQLSAFFPFYRNHNTLAAAPQEAYVWSSVIDATKSAMTIRFNLLPYMYTLFEQAHTTGSNVMRALSWEFPDDPSLANADRQFFLGPAILVTPVLEPNASTVNGVFPGSGKGEVYYDWYTQSVVNASAGQNVTIGAPLGHIPVHVRGGHVLPMQQMAMTTTAARKTSWNILVALGLEGTAKGSLYLDDGESITPNATLTIDLTASKSSLYASGRGLYSDSNPLSNVTVLGLGKEPTNVTLNGKSVGSTAYNSSSKALVISGLQNATSSGVWSQDWVLKW